jgi:hypothetical protein
VLGLLTFEHRIIGDETKGSKLGVVPQDCKEGRMGNRNLYHFCLAILIFMDISVPLALIAVLLRSSLTSTLSLFPNQPVAEMQVPAKVDEITILTPVKADDTVKPDMPPADSLVYVGQA